MKFRIVSSSSNGTRIWGYRARKQVRKGLDKYPRCYIFPTYFLNLKEKKTTYLNARIRHETVYSKQLHYFNRLGVSFGFSIFLNLACHLMLLRLYQETWVSQRICRPSCFCFVVSFWVMMLLLKLVCLLLSM